MGTIWDLDFWDLQSSWRVWECFGTNLGPVLDRLGIKTQFKGILGHAWDNTDFGTLFGNTGDHFGTTLGQNSFY
jgi:hypothetical protein